MILLALALSAQQQPLPVRPLGPITHVSQDSLASVTAAVPTSGGRVFVNDIIARRILLFDSSLAKATIVADSTGATASAYGGRPGTLLPYRGDSALLITPASLSMLVLSPAGGITRTMAMPPATGGLVGAVLGNAGFDAQGRMVYFVPARSPSSPPATDPTAPIVMRGADSGFIVRFDLQARKLDTVVALKIPPFKMTLNRGEPGRPFVSQTQTLYPIPSVDDWVPLRDGSLAVVRGRDYHVEWLGTDGQWVTTPKMPFAWEHLDDDRKRAIIDSATAALQASTDSMQARGAARAAAEAGPARPGRAGPGTATVMRMLVAPAEVADVPDYRPPMRQGSTRADADGNIWVQTTVIVDKRPVYDIVNRKGELIDRVQLPQFRRIAGFGPGVVYMAVIDSNKVVHLESARVK